MKRSIFTMALVALSMGGTELALAQDSTAVARTEEEGGAPVRKKLSGPRFGFTVFTGDVAVYRQQMGKEAIMTQFGWQAETQIASLSSGNQALMEWVFLVGGVEQDEINLSLSWLTGYRLESGLELGVGPAVSVSKDNTRPSTSMIVAGGATLPFGDLHIPIHMAVAMAQGGPRITTLLGWIVN